MQLRKNKQNYFNYYTSKGIKLIENENIYLLGYNIRKVNFVKINDYGKRN